MLSSHLKSNWEENHHDISYFNRWNDCEWSYKNTVIKQIQRICWIDWNFEDRNQQQQAQWQQVQQQQVQQQQVQQQQVWQD